jgi:hypothetical protein
VATSKTALYVLLAALALAALTNRWVAASGSRPGFNIVSFDEVYFGAQWIAFGLTLGGLGLLALQWRETGQFPLLILLGVALLAFFVATGIPQTTNSYQWKSGDVGLKSWMSASDSAREAKEVMPHVVGTWKSDRTTYAIAADSVSITSGGRTEVFGAACPGGALIKFAYATGDTLQQNPAAYKYYPLLDGARVPSLEVACEGRLFTFLKVADGKGLAFRDLHNPNPSIESVTR